VAAKKVWHKYKQEEVYTDLVIEIFDRIEEDILLQCLEVVQNRFEYVTHKYPNLTRDELKFVLCVTWVDIDYLVTGLRRKLCPEPRTFEKYLMVSKYQKKSAVYYKRPCIGDVSQAWRLPRDLQPMKKQRLYSC